MPGPDCDIYSQALSLATDAGTACGAINFYMGRFYSVDAGALARGVACAFAAQDAGRPFVFITGFGGADTGYATAYVRTPDGASFQLTQAFTHCGGATELDQSSCDLFIPTTILFPPEPDGGLLPGITCANQGASACICTPKPCT